MKMSVAVKNFVVGTVVLLAGFMLFLAVLKINEPLFDRTELRDENGYQMYCSCPE